MSPYRAVSRSNKVRTSLTQHIFNLTLITDTAGGMGRHLGVFSCTLLMSVSLACFRCLPLSILLHSIGRIIGTGIFSTPASILGSVGSVGASLMLWVLGFVLSFCGLFIWLELGTMFPRSGGEKVYLEAVYRRPRHLSTFIFASNAIILGFSASNCLVSVSLACRTFSNPILVFRYSRASESFLSIAFPGQSQL